MVLTSVLSMIRYVSGVEERDFVDRLHSFFTTNLLVALSVLVSFKQFGGHPIECLTPDTFTSAWEEYAESYCFAQDTYNVPMYEVVDGMPETEKYNRRITYYQWTPFYLLFAAACFRIPICIWKSLSDYSGIKIKEIVKMALNNENVKPEIKRANIKSISCHLQGALRFHRRLKRRNIEPHRLSWLFNPYSSAYVSLVFLGVKCSALINVLFQLYLMNRFLQTNKYPLYGWGAVVGIYLLGCSPIKFNSKFNLLDGQSWERSGLFPRITLCDLEMRTMGQVQEFTLQCVLLINLLNEKIFILLWFWYAFLLIITTISSIHWFIIIFFNCLSKRFIARHLEMSELDFDAEDPDDKKHANSFLSNYLRTDGIFIIRTLASRSGVIFTTEVLAELYRSYCGIEAELRRSNSDGNLTMAQLDQSEKENRKNIRKIKIKHHEKERLIQPVFSPDLAALKKQIRPDESITIEKNETTESSV